ncbi:hypothetical protein [Mycobacterium sherrisii]|uniref:hypothetical protein n=1 Tax=Mycobacterium sherrisii TaxID=243061 RepID=UPI000A151F0F|nr:hypothetical protein [Mycobacterium sherrisii]MCV7029918.1 hypothetical protein [Mycobacterium sherrisii]MEC4762542.1 hypothetical protein [Mycobacterium sherrisii]ORW85013.1 hypothetical protein AWC25_23240 [Mycobacterium sherrisii]
MTIESDLRPPRGRPYLGYVREPSAAGSKVLDPTGAACRHCVSAPANHADVVQATLFADMLRAEHAELGAVVRAQRPEDRPSAEQLLQLQARMKEVRRLLEALEKRFGQSATVEISTPPTGFVRDEHRR